MQSTYPESHLAFRDKASALLGGAALLSALLFWPFLGNLAAYVALILCIPAAALGFRRAAWNRMLRAPWLWAFWGGFLMLVTAFLLQKDWSDLTSIGDFLIFALSPIIALAVAPLGRTRFSVQSLALTTIMAAAIAACVGIYGVMQGQDRVVVANLSPIHFADLAIMFGFMGLGVTLSGRSPWRWLALIGLFFGLIAALASGSRAALLVGCALALLYGAFLMQRSSMKVWLKLLAPLAMGATVILAFYLANVVGFTRPFDAIRASWGTLTGDLGGDTSTIYRLEMYRAGLRAFFDAPLVGHGWHNQLAASYPYLSEMGQRGYADEGWGYIHNDALSLLVAAGLLGFLAYCLFLAAPLLALRQHAPDENRTVRNYLAMSFTLGLLVSGMTDVLFMVELPKLLLIMVTASLFFLNERGESAV